MEQHTERQTEKDIQSRQRNKRTRKNPDNKHADETYTVRCKVVNKYPMVQVHVSNKTDRFMHIQTGSRREEERE